MVHPGDVETDRIIVGVSGSTADYPTSQQLNLTRFIRGPGWSLGNLGGWSTGDSIYTNLTVGTRGIHQGVTVNLQKHAVGDTAGIYAYAFSDMGSTALSDEGVSGATIESGENRGWFHGVIASTSGVGDRSPVLHYTSGNNWTTDGAFLLDLSKGAIAGHISGPSQSSDCAKFLHALPVTGITVLGRTGQLPITTAWATIDAAIENPKTTADVNTDRVLRVRLGKIKGGAHPFVAGGVVTIAGPNYPEQAFIRKVEQPLDGFQLITLSLRNPQSAGAVIFQGGISGQYLSFDANLGLHDGMRSTYYAFGSLSGTDLIYGFNNGGSIGGILPMTGEEAESTSGTNAGFHLFPGAEIVSNRTLGASPLLEPNGVQWAVGDSVENPHSPAAGGTGLWVVRHLYTPANKTGETDGILLHAEGPGMGAGFQALRLLNGSPKNQYVAFGGPLAAPGGIRLQGIFDYPLSIDTAPSSGTPIIDIGSLPGGLAAKDVSIPIPLVRFRSSAGGELSFTPSTRSWAMDHIVVDTLARSSTGSTDMAGRITLRSGKNTRSFQNAYTSPPVCVASDTSRVAAVQIQTTSTVLTIIGTENDIVSYICVAGN